MKNVKVAKAVGVVEMIKVKTVKPATVKAVITRTKKKTWKLAYVVGKQTFELKQEFTKIEAALGILNCTGSLRVQDEKKNKIELV